jgi:hypothetical protein
MTTTLDPAPDDAAVRDAHDAREVRLADGADRLRRGRRSIVGGPNFLLGVAATLMVFGVTAIVIGWVGAAHSTFVEEQVPYLISGGLLGVALTTVGALTFFTHWLTVSIREAREHEAARRQDHAELVQALRALAAQENSDGGARSTQPRRPVRRAPRGS